MTRPAMSMIEERAIPQIKLPVSKTPKKVKNMAFVSKMANILPINGCIVQLAHNQLEYEALDWVDVETEWLYLAKR